MKTFLSWLALWILAVVVVDAGKKDKLMWTHELVLDTENKFRVLWIPKEEDITFELQVKTIQVIDWASLKFEFVF